LRKGFTLIFSIVMLLIFSSLAVSLLSISSESADTSSKSFLYSRATLLARSATEVALLTIGSTDNNSSDCLKRLNIELPDDDLNFRVYADFHYVGYSSCDRNFIESVKYEDSIGTVLIDVYVEGHGVRYHRRTLQKP
jgi:hypothetical protein